MEVCMENVKEINIGQDSSNIPWWIFKKCREFAKLVQSVCWFDCEIIADQILVWQLD